VVQWGSWGNRTVASDIDKLLNYIVRHYLVRQDVLTIERDATASDPGDAIVEDQERITRFEEARAGSLEEAFRDGLLRADAARRAGGSAISLDDRKPEDNRQADALVNFLVRSKLATSTARETDAQHYIYTVSIDWEALDRVAREAKTSLPKVLGYGG
jgi:hypothetical protein